MLSDAYPSFARSHRVSEEMFREEEERGSAKQLKMTAAMARLQKKKDAAAVQVQ